jgi:DNA-binding CsgD family transcriptional regulator
LSENRGISEEAGAASEASKPRLCASRENCWPICDWATELPRLAWLVKRGMRASTVAAGAAEIGRKLRALLIKDSDEITPPPEKLSKRQKQLVVMLDRGLSNRDIADELQISEHTVKVHLWRLFRRLNVKSRSQASHLARMRGLV